MKKLLALKGFDNISLNPALLNLIKSSFTAITIEKEDLIRFNKAGFNDILSKPFKADNFFNKIYLQLIKKH